MATQTKLMSFRINELSGARVQEGPVNSDLQGFIDWSMTDYNVSTVLPWNNWGSALGVAQLRSSRYFVCCFDAVSRRRRSHDILNIHKRRTDLDT